MFAKNIKRCNSNWRTTRIGLDHASIRSNILGEQNKLVSFIIKLIDHLKR